MLFRSLASTAIALALAASAQAANLAGEVEEFDGSATAQAPGAPLRALDDGEPIFAGDRILTAGDSRLLLRFLDETTLAVGENGDLTIDAFVFDPGAGGAFNVDMAKGVFRYLSGQIAARDPNDVRLNTVFGTIGVRGTHVLTRIGDGPELIVLLPEDDPARPPAIVVSNSGGAVTINAPEFGTEIAGPGIAPTPPRRYNLQVINTLTRSLGRIRGRLNRPNFR